MSRSGVGPAGLFKPLTSRCWNQNPQRQADDKDPESNPRKSRDQTQRTLPPTEQHEEQERQGKVKVFLDRQAPSMIARAEKIVLHVEDVRQQLHKCKFK